MINDNSEKQNQAEHTTPIIADNSDLIFQAAKVESSQQNELIISIPVIQYPAENSIPVITDNRERLGQETQRSILTESTRLRSIQKTNTSHSRQTMQSTTDNNLSPMKGPVVPKQTKQTNQMVDEQLLNSSSSPFIIITETNTIHNHNNMPKPSTQLFKNTQPTTNAKPKTVTHELKVEKTRLISKMKIIKSKKTGRGPKHLIFKNIPFSTEDEKFQPSAKDNQNTMQSQKIILQNPTGQFKPPTMLYYGFKPLTKTATLRPSKSALVQTSPGIFKPPSKYNYGFKPVYKDSSK